MTDFLNYMGELYEDRKYYITCTLYISPETPMLYFQTRENCLVVGVDRRDYNIFVAFAVIMAN